MKKTKTTFVTALSIALVLVIILLSSYAFWKVKDGQSGSNTILGSCLNFEFIELEDDNQNPIGGFTLVNAMPVSDEEGSSHAGYTFKVENTCTDAVNYQVVLESLKIMNEDTNTYYPEGKYFADDKIKVQLDNGTIKTYSEYEQVDNDSTAANINEIRKTRELLTGTVTGGNTNTHNIKMWISSESTAEDIEKIFRSKVKVIAGQGIEASAPVDPTSHIEIVGDNCTIDDIGCEVAIGAEHFYVIGEDENDSNNVKLLAKYNLLVGSKGVDKNNYTVISNYTEDDEGYNLQSPEANGYSLSLYTLMDRDNNVFTTYTPDTKASVFAGLTIEEKENLAGVRMNNDDLDYLESVGAVPFYTPDGNGDAYWYGTDINTPDPNYGSSYPTDVYNENSVVYQYVDTYKNYLEDTNGITITDARILSGDEVLALGCLKSTCFNDGILVNGREWIFDTSYWLSTARNGRSAWMMFAFGFIYQEGGSTDVMAGVRPVIVVPKSIFD